MQPLAIRPMRIRQARPSDAPSLTAVKIAAWRAAYGEIFPPGFLDQLDYSQQYWDRHLDGLLVSEADDVLTGYCSFGESDVEGWGEIRAIYVHPSVQGRGHGSALIQHGIDGLIGRGFDRALLWVIDGNDRARDFYQSRGWMLAAPIRLEEIGGANVTLLRYDLDPLASSS